MESTTPAYMTPFTGATCDMCGEDGTHSAVLRATGDPFFKAGFDGLICDGCEHSMARYLADRAWDEAHGPEGAP